MIKDKFLRKVFILLALAFLFWFLWAVKGIIMYMAVASIVSLVATPAVDFLDGLHIGRVKVPDTAAIIIVMLLMFVVCAGVLALLVPLVTSQAENLSLLDAAKAKENALLIYHNAMDMLKDYGVIKQTPELTTDYIKTVDFSFIPNLINSVVSSLGSIITFVFSVVFFAFFFLKERGRASSFILSVVPDGTEKKVSDMMQKTRSLLSRYVIGLLVQQSLIFCFTLILLLSFGVQNPFIIAFIVALLNIVPYIGPFMGGVLLVSLTMLSNISQPIGELMPVTLWVLGGFIVIQLFDNFVSQPLIFSNSVKAHPIEIFTVTLIGGTLFGVLGMIVAVPAYTIIRIMAKEFFWESKIVRVLTKNI